MTISAISSAVGFGWILQSATNKTSDSNIIIDNAPTGFNPSPDKISSIYFRCHRYCPKVPQIKLSASPRFTIIAPIAVVFVLIISLAKAGVTPFLSIIPKYASQYSLNLGSFWGFTSSKSLPCTSGNPYLSILFSTTSGRPISMGLSFVSSNKAKAVLSVRSSSPSAKTILRDDVFAASKTGFIKIVDL